MSIYPVIDCHPRHNPHHYQIADISVLSKHNAMCFLWDVSAQCSIRGGHLEEVNTYRRFPGQPIAAELRRCLLSGKWISVWLHTLIAPRAAVEVTGGGGGRAPRWARRWPDLLGGRRTRRGRGSR